MPVPIAAEQLSAPSTDGRTAGHVIPPPVRSPIGGSRIRQALRDIHELDIIDKHRQPHFVHTAMSVVPVLAMTPDYGFKNDPAFGVPLVSNARVDTWTFTSKPPASYVNVHPGIESAIGLEHGNDRLEVLANLGGCILAVAATIDRFARFFPRLERPLMNIRWILEGLNPPR